VIGVFSSLLMRALNGPGENGRPAEGRPADSKVSRLVDAAERGVAAEMAEGTSRGTSDGKFAVTGVDSDSVGFVPGMISGERMDVAHKRASQVNDSKASAKLPLTQVPTCLVWLIS
jgi:hypothetical protein